MFLVLSGSFIMFSVSAMQYWSTNYFITVLGAPQLAAFKYFGIVAITGPMAGAILSALVTDRLGGYHSENLMKFALIVGIGLSTGAFFITIEYHMYMSIFLFWITLCSGALLLPMVIGIMLTKVEPE